ncbi:MAG: biotin transporter BioY [Eubacteriales bacterium]|nr:biotin transporter BioY [Eubacteriales bacterium]
MKLTVRDVTFAALFAALVAAGAYLTIPLPYLPLTLQTFFVMTAGLLLGAKRGMLALGVYILLGLTGLPVFAGGRGGIASVVMPSFGYLLGMLAAAGVMGRLAARRDAGFWRLLATALVGTAVIYLVGLPYMYGVYRWYLGQDKPLSWVLYYGFATSILPDLVKCVLAAALCARLKRVLPAA